MTFTRFWHRVIGQVECWLHEFGSTTILFREMKAPSGTYVWLLADLDLGFEIMLPEGARRLDRSRTSLVNTARWSLSEGTANQSAMIVSTAMHMHTPTLWNGSAGFERTPAQRYIEASITN